MEMPFEIDAEVKQQLRAARLNQYKNQIYALQMDLAAFEAIDDEANIKFTKKALEEGIKAYQAVEAM